MKDKSIECKNEPKIYSSKQKNPKGYILYFHGGGLLFGSKFDLPKYHIDRITEAGYDIVSFNYPLAPESKLPSIIKYILDSINSFTKDLNKPYFLWGRSAGAYLCLLAYSKGLNVKPNGIISYYGYGLLVPNWHSKPSNYYLKYPLVEKESIRNLIQNEMILSAPVNPRFLIYLYTRQTGNWLEVISNMSEEEFLNEYGLNNIDFSHYPPVLLAHNTKDNDVPYEESIELSKRIKDVELLTFTTAEHDFDRNTENPNTVKLINETIGFLDRYVGGDD